MLGVRFAEKKQLSPSKAAGLEARVTWHRDKNRQMGRCASVYLQDAHLCIPDSVLLQTVK
jgi:hypothetical protein